MDRADGTLLYGELASWWPLLSAPEDYREEAEIFWSALASTVSGPLRTLLELGSGGGNNASHLKRRAALTLVDRSPDMIAVSRARNPESEHAVGDMRTVRLSRTFDAVFLHDALSYLLTEDDLRAACRTAFLHVRPGGGALLVPDWTRESFRPETSSGGHDGRGGDRRSLRYLCWVRDPDPSDTEVAMEFAYLLRAGDGPTRVAHEVHRCGLFSRASWLDALREAGFEASALPFAHSSFAPGETREMFAGRHRS